MNLITILVLLFIALFVLVQLGERFGKPMTEQQQHQYSKWIMILLAIMILASMIKYYT